MKPKPEEVTASTPDSRRYGAWVAGRLLGSGGSGSVYLARRADGQYEREAALKVIAAHGGDRDSGRRFLSEAKALAALAHPNITRYLDGGVADDGAPYIVMEYVSGAPITAHADDRRLTPSERVRLFLPVCDAIDYAHRQLVLHLDLKPSNILVGADGRPRLLDFGAAKLLAAPGMPVTVTRSDTGTVRYASPEQLAGSTVTTASDVYSAGVVLYELLAGESPFRLPRAPGDEAARLGERVANQAFLTRRTSPRRLQGLLSGDLRAILGMCLAESPAARYSSAAALRADLEAWLDGRPVSARAPTLSYRALKFIRRNRLATALAGVSLLAAGAGVGSIVKQRRIAERRFDDVRALARYQMFSLHDKLAGLSGSSPARAALLEQSTRYLDALSAEAGGDAALGEELAEGYLRLGDLLTNSGFAGGRAGAARDAYDKGRRIARALDTPGARRTLASIEFNSAVAPDVTVDAQTVETAARNAVAELRMAIRMAPASPENYVRLGDIIAVAAEKARSATGMSDGDAKAAGPFGEAMQAYQKALELGADPALIRRKRWDVASREAYVLSMTEPARAIARSNAALAEIERASAAERRDIRVMRIESELHSHVAWAEGQSKRFAESIAANQRSAAVFSKLLEAEPGNIRLAYDLAGTYRSLGIVQGYGKRWRDAAASFERAVEMHERVLGGGPNTQSEFLRAELTGRIAHMWREAGDAARSGEMARRAVAWLAPLCERKPPNASHLVQMASLLASELAVRDPVKAVSYARRARELRRNIVADQVLIAALVASGEWDEAEKLLAPLEKAAGDADIMLKETVRSLRTGLDDARRKVRR